LSKYEHCTTRNVDTFSHRWDFALTTIAFLGYVALLTIYIAKNKAIVMKNYSWIRVFPASILIRFFFRWQVSKELCFMLRSGAKIVLNLLILMLCIFFIFGVVGVTFFKNGLKNASVEDDGIPEYALDYANFDTLGNSFILLTQAFLGEAFHELLTVTRTCWSKTTGEDENWDGNWFIIIFFFLMSVLFNNLFFGLLLNIFSDLYEAQQDGEELNNELVRCTHMPSILDEEQSQSFLVEDLAEKSTMSFRFVNKKARSKASKTEDVSEMVEIAHLESVDLSASTLLSCEI